MDFFKNYIFLQMISFSLLFTAHAFGADRVLVNPRADEDIVLKSNNSSEPTKPADGTQEVLRVKGANSTAIFANGVGSTDSSDSSPVIDLGETLSKSNIVIPAAETWTVNGSLKTTGIVTGAGSLVGTGDISSIDAGANGDDVVFDGNIILNGSFNSLQKNKWQKKQFLTANTSITVAETFPDLTFNNLEPGKTYLLMASFRLVGVAGDPGLEIDALNGSQNILSLDLTDSDVSTKVHTVSSSAIFTASSSSVTWEVPLAGGVNRVQGGVGPNTTFAILVELTNFEETNQW